MSEFWPALEGFALGGGDEARLTFPAVATAADVAAGAGSGAAGSGSGSGSGGSGGGGGGAAGCADAGPALTGFALAGDAARLAFPAAGEAV